MNARVPLALVLLAAATAGCGAEFDPPHELKTLRILAVQKTEPYAKPGEEVELSMLWHDGSPRAPRPVEVAWFSGCFNPPGDLYQGCFAQLAQGGSPGPSGLPPGFQLGTGDTFKFTLPSDVISARPPPADPKQPPYGLAYVFFAACAGKLDRPPSRSFAFPRLLRPEWQDVSAPTHCRWLLRHHAFDSYRKFKNPIRTGRTTKRDTAGSCIDGARVGNPPRREPSTAPACSLHQRACADDGDERSDISISTRWTLERGGRPDSPSTPTARRMAKMWIRYYVTRGSEDDAHALLNDAWRAGTATTARSPGMRAAAGRSRVR
ncbi:MAG: hypothetical protein U0263_06975 [Polyangiaceae bacterium]